MHKLIMLSAVYQQSSDDNDIGRAADPENRLLWRMNRQRLDFEAMRDSMLAVSGELDPTMGGRPVDLALVVIAPPHGLRLHRPPESAEHVPRVRFRQPRQPQPAAVFHDGAAAGAVHDEQPVRDRVREESREAAGDRGGDRGFQEDRMLYQILFGRAASPRELDLGLQYVGGESGVSPVGLSKWEKYAQVLLETNEFVFVD